MGVAVTGIGMVSSLGLNVDKNWSNMVQGKSGIKLIDEFSSLKDLDTKIAGQIDDEGLELQIKEFIKKRDRKKMTRTTKMGLLAAQEAITDSGILNSSINPEKIGVILGVINLMSNQEKNSHLIVKSMPNSVSAWISLMNNFKGPNFNISTACASSAYAISLGKMFIESGLLDCVIVGGTDSHVNPVHLKGFNEMMAMSTNNKAGDCASKPFSIDRDGFVMGEGAGVLILENEKIAKERDAYIYGSLIGSSLTSEAFDITAPETDGVGMARTMKLALEDAGLDMTDIDYINAHGTGTYLNDKYETIAIKKCFKEHAYNINISSTKSMIGHTLGASGAIEAIITLLTFKHDFITPTINFTPDPELDLNYTPNEGVEKKVNYALSNSFGFGGHNASLVFANIE